ncbi:NfeD family protein [Patulibacter sp. NPDC049589]|uniref:NfeD family protein n=1 Tax=Patulibacter sp. NPDC049589 TaxID=3154731 RepID=UPI0034276725
MDAWVPWLLIAVVLGVGEVLTLSLFLGPFAIGGGAATLASLAGADTGPQIAIFALVTALMFGFVRPIAKRHLRQPHATKTGTAALVGRTALVVRAIEGPELLGQVRLDGEIWTARAEGHEPVAVGQTVTVLEIRGATAVVAD